MKFSQILGLSFLFASAINARSIDTLSNDDKANDDKYYLCYVNNDQGEYKVYTDDKTQKRGAAQVFIESLVDDINTLIIDNKDTYQNPEKLDEIEEAAQLKKRSEESIIYDEANFVYPISSVNDRVVLYAYLSKTLADDLPSQFEKVVECVPEKTNYQVFHKNYNVDEILAETKWKNLSVRENADQHLSLISQGKINQNSSKYDTNYYYPSTAGKGVDIVFVDSSFNFGYSEFSNTDQRSVECKAIVNNAKISTNVSGGCDISKVYHGESTSVTAAGKTNGVASLANVYGVAVPTTDKGELKDSDIFAGVQYVYEKLIRPHKTVVNFSLGGLEQQGTQSYKQYKALIDAITQNGGIVIAAAGNNGYNLDASTYRTYDMLPCELENTICVGGIDNSRRTSRDIYGVVDFSNYGKNVDLYAPSNVKVQVKINGKVTLDDTHGTSFSCPIVSGIVATIISENSTVSYTKDSMYKQLYEYGKDQIINIKNGSTSFLANNGKRIVYTGDSINTKTTTTVRPRTTTPAVSPRTTTTTATRTRTTTTSKPTPTNTNNNDCYGRSIGYSCCKSCNVYYTTTDSEGHLWGYESIIDYLFGSACSMKYSCY